MPALGLKSAFFGLSFQENVINFAERVPEWYPAPHYQQIAYQTMTLYTGLRSYPQVICILRLGAPLMLKWCGQFISGVVSFTELQPVVDQIIFM